LDRREAVAGRGPAGPQARRGYFEEIEPQLYRFPAIDPADFRGWLEAIGQDPAELRRGVSAAPERREPDVQGDGRADDHPASRDDHDLVLR